MNKLTFRINAQNLKYFNTIILFVLIGSSILKAQNPLYQADYYALSFTNPARGSESLTLIIPSRADTVYKPKLLPDKISFMENLLWGENGLTRKIGIASPLTLEVRKHELEVRRFMLSAHQIGGFTTLALMIATCYYGQRIIDGGVDGRRSFQSTKNTLVAATITSYSLTAMLSILSPPPYIRRDESSTTTLHKTLAWFHAAGMIITPILGSLINTNRAFNMDKAHYHQISGYITTLFFATAMFVITL